MTDDLGARAEALRLAREAGWHLPEWWGEEHADMIARLIALARSRPGWITTDEDYRQLRRDLHATQEGADRLQAELDALRKLLLDARSSLGADLLV